MIKKTFTSRGERMDLTTLERQHSEIEEVVVKIKQIIDNNSIDEDAAEIAKQISMLTGKLRVHLRTEDDSMYPYLLETGDEKVKALVKEYADEMGHISDEFMAYKDKFNTKTKIINDTQEFLTQTKEVFKVLEARMIKEDRYLYKYI